MEGRGGGDNSDVLIRFWPVAWGHRALGENVESSKNSGTASALKVAGLERVIRKLVQCHVFV